MFEAWLPLKTPLQRLIWLRRFVSGGASADNKVGTAKVGVAKAG